MAYIQQFSETALCRCGCELPAPLMSQTHTKRGMVKGQPFAFRVGHSRRGRDVANGNYRKVGVRLQHVIIAEKALGKPLPAGAEVHHADENKQNNANCNLVICQDHAYHFLLHTRARTVRAGGNPDTHKVCGKCATVKLFSDFGKNRNQGSGFSVWCKSCQSEYDKSRRAA